MLKGKSVIGKEILSLEDGAKIDKVSDVVVDPQGRRLVALVVSEGGFMSSSKVIPIEEVSSFGRDAVVVRSLDSLVSVSNDPDLRVLVESEEKILGKNVYTTTGDEQGKIADIYFEERTGEVVGYEVSGGLLGDASKGTSYLATDEIATIGSDVIYVEPDTAQVLDAQVGGIQGAVQGVGEKLGQARQTAAGKLGEVKEGAGRQAAESRPEDSLIGKRTGSDVESDSGSVIVAQGRRIRPEDVTAAKQAGKLQALTASVALGTAQNAGAGVKDAAGAAGDTAGSLWDQFTAKIGEMTDATGKRVDEQQTKQRLASIADAVGRPVTKVILDRQDNVILNMGDIISHLAIQRAHEAGGLDSLLDSVYKGEVQFTKEEMRAPAEAQAEATVEKSSGGAVIVDELQTKVQTAEQEREAEKERKRQEADVDRQRREQERQTRSTEREAARRSREADEEPAGTERPRVAVGPGAGVESASRQRQSTRSR